MYIYFNERTNDSHLIQVKLQQCQRRALPSLVSHFRVVVVVLPGPAVVVVVDVHDDVLEQGVDVHILDQIQEQGTETHP